EEMLDAHVLVLELLRLLLRLPEAVPQLGAGLRAGSAALDLRELRELSLDGGAGIGARHPDPIEDAGDEALRILEEDREEVVDLDAGVPAVLSGVHGSQDGLPRLVRESVEVHGVPPWLTTMHASDIPRRGSYCKPPGALRIEETWAAEGRPRMPERHVPLAARPGRSADPATLATRHGGGP